MGDGCYSHCDVVLELVPQGRFASCRPNNDLITISEYKRSCSLFYASSHPRAIRQLTGTDIDLISRPNDRAGDGPPPGALQGDEVVQVAGSAQVCADMKTVLVVWLGRSGCFSRAMGWCRSPATRRCVCVCLGLCVLLVRGCLSVAWVHLVTVCSNTQSTTISHNAQHKHTQAVRDAVRIILVAVRGNMARGQLMFRHQPPHGGELTLYLCFQPANTEAAAAQLPASRSRLRVLPAAACVACPPHTCCLDQHPNLTPRCPHSPSRSPRAQPPCPAAATAWPRRRRPRARRRI